MCLTPCSVATEFSILRATSVSSWAGRGTGQRCVDDDHGQIDVREVLDLHRAEAHQPDQRQQQEEQDRRDRIRMDQEETFIIGVVRICRPGPRHRTSVAIGQEADAVRDDLRRASRPPRISMRSPTRRPTPPWSAPPWLSAHRRGRRSEAVAQQHRALRQRQRRPTAERELAAREHAGLGAGPGRQVHVDQAVARLRVDGRRDHAHPARHRRRRCGVTPHACPA
jgi:hypothetical protein